MRVIGVGTIRSSMSAETLPSGKFGANAARFRLNAPTDNLLSAPCVQRLVGRGLHGVTCCIAGPKPSGTRPSLFLGRVRLSCRCGARHDLGRGTDRSSASASASAPPRRSVPRGRSGSPPMPEYEWRAVHDAAAPDDARASSARPLHLILDGLPATRSRWSRSTSLNGTLTLHYLPTMTLTSIQTN